MQTKTDLYVSTLHLFAQLLHLNGTKLSYSDQVVHLGHVLTSNIDDIADIMRATKDMNRKANSPLCTFLFVLPHIKTFLLKFYCLSLYGCCLWSLNAPSIKTIEIALNKILHKIWHLPLRTHTGIVHCVAQIHTISNILHQRFQSFLFKALTSSSHLIRTIFTQSAYLGNCFTGYNNHNGHLHVRA